jgi:hypothetical protein
MYEPADRQRAKIECSDEDLIGNPYRLYELDRRSSSPISVETVDRGAFPADVVRERFPLEEPSRAVEALDPRRVKALVVSTLEEAAGSEGHTLLPSREVVRRVRDLALSPPCPLTSDALRLVDTQPGSDLVRQETGVEPTYQLLRLRDAGAKIKEEVLRRLEGRRHAAAHDWRGIVDQCLVNTDQNTDEDEPMARSEKASALSELYCSRFSVLVGPAGTGKTTLLKALCALPEVREGKIALLAPTGKARVRLEQQTQAGRGLTIAQFLLPLDRFDPDTGTYRVLGPINRSRGYRTIIIDEASMLTEEQLAAVFDAVQGVERLILVGQTRYDDKAASGSRPRGMMTVSISTSPRTGATIGTILSDRAAVSSEGILTDTGAVSGLNMIATRLSPGAISESSSSHLPPSEGL